MMHVNFGSNFIGVGEDHKGKHAFNFANRTHVEKLQSLFLKNKDIICWYEGPKRNQKSPSFINFVKELKNWQSKKEELKSSNIIEDGWELSLKFKRDEEMTGILLGAESYEYEKLLGSQLNSRQSLAEAFVASKAIKGSQSSPVTMQELIKCLSENNGPSDVLNEMMQPNSANRKTLDAIYAGSYDAMRAKYFSGHGGSKTSSSIYKRVDAFNSARDKHLAKLMKTKGGIFLAGDGHIEGIDNFL